MLDGRLGGIVVAGACRHQPDCTALRQPGVVPCQFTPLADLEAPQLEKYRGEGGWPQPGVSPVSPINIALGT